MYIYPENLKAKPKLWFWHLKDVAIIGLALLVSVFALAQGVGFTPLALNSRESFQNNKNWYQQRLEQETNPKIRELLMRDRAHLDEIQASMATAREFALAVPVERRKGENLRAVLTRIEEQIRGQGFHVRLAGEQDVKRLLAVYYAQDVTTEYFEDFDGERAGLAYG